MPLWLLRRDYIIISKYKQAKKKKVDEFLRKNRQRDRRRFIGGGGLAGYICPWLPHLPYSSCTQKRKVFISIDELDHW
jgi:hypothetical protein